MTLINIVLHDTTPRCSICYHLFIWHIKHYMYREKDIVTPCEHGGDYDYSPHCKCTYYYDCISEEDIL